MMRSLRTRLFLGTTLASALVLSVLAIAINLSVRRLLSAEFDRVLLERARTLASLVEQHGPDVHFDYQPAQFPEFERKDRPAYFEVYLDGLRFKNSPSLHAPLLAAIPPSAPPAVTPLSLPDNSPGRAISMAFQPFLDIAPEEAEWQKQFPRPSALIIVAQDTVDLDRTLARVRLLIASLCAAAALLCGTALLLIVNRSLKPVRALASTIESLRETDLAASLNPNLVPSELAPVVDRLNGLLLRLSRAFTRERNFTADAAHELRTPLAGLLTTLEVCRSRPRESADYQLAIDKSLAMLLHMQSLIENLLLLARIDSGQLTARRVLLDLPTFLRTCWQPFEDRAQQKQITLHFTLPDSATLPPLSADPEFLRIIFNNLFDNAISYTPEAGRIDVTASATPSAITLQITNPAPSLTPDDLPHLTERFWRKDPSRSATGLHAGLGLSLTHRLLSLHQATLTPTLTPPTFTATLTFPTSTPPISSL